MSVATLLATLSPQWLPILVVVCLVPILTMLLLRGKGDKGLKHPPSPPSLPVIGHLHLLGRLPHVSLFKLSKKYGPIMRVKMGSIPSIIISSAEYSKVVLKDLDLETCSRPPATVPGKMSYNFLDVAFAPYSEYWREMRKIIIFELLSMKKVQMLWYAREAQMDNLLHSLNHAYPNPINITKKIFEITDGFIGTVAFGKSYGKVSFKNELSEVVQGAMDMLGTFHFADYYPSLGKYIDMLTGDAARQDDIFNQIDGYLNQALAQHRDPKRPKPEHEDLVDILLGLMRDKKSTFTMTDNHIKAVLMVIN
ncbi:hypothetical protein Tsubulata_011188 [Turnera subulata]|uniref:Cytochrome P450 n=1 Tax=Turnera subulata TaxID=218843 RepID=A0A9Q0F8B2_9ROSI|nr:hypothetical protein Tsubulata_011188 [Turnera subulata]